MKVSLVRICANFSEVANSGSREVVGWPPTDLNLAGAYIDNCSMHLPSQPIAVPVYSSKVVYPSLGQKIALEAAHRLEKSHYSVT